MRREPVSMSDVVVRYSANEMPLPTIERLQRDTCEQFDHGEIDARQALRITNLLLTIALMKLDEVTS